MIGWNQAFIKTKKAKQKQKDERVVDDNLAKILVALHVFCRNRATIFELPKLR
jgi:hypothetical protein